MDLRRDCDTIVEEAIRAVLPDEAVKRTLKDVEFADGKVVLVAAGKAAWQMSKAAYEILGDRIDSGIVITKYDHVKGPIGSFTMIEAGHPVCDENSFRGTQLALDMVSELTAQDTVLFLLSGGGSALFEKPLIAPDEMVRLNGEMLACGADITEINTIRKRMSAVKGGRFAETVYPAKVYQIILSDIVGDPLDMIASGPAYPDSSTAYDAKAIVDRYNISMSDDMARLLEAETPKSLSNVETHLNGSVRQLVSAASDSARRLGYTPVILTDCLECEAGDAGLFLGAIAKAHSDSDKDMAFIAGGETVVHLKGNGKGGRNQQLALSAACCIKGIDNVAIFSVGSDGTDGPTDAAGGFVDGHTVDDSIEGRKTADVKAALDDNDAYHFLEKSGGLIMTGATGTNVNDVAVVLIKSAV